MDFKVICGNRHQDRVLPGITKAVKAPESDIASLVGLKGRDEGLDFVRSLASEALHSVGEEFFALNDGEFNKLGHGHFAGDARGVNGLVEDGTQVAEDVENNTWRLVKEHLTEPDFMAIISSVCISLDRVGPLLIIGECADPRFKVTKMVFCPL